MAEVYKLLLILWGFTVIGSFFILPFLWALISNLFIAFVGPTIAIFIYAPFKRFFGVIHEPYPDYITGAAEAALYYLGIQYLSTITALPSNLLWVTFIIYIVNQLTRVFRGRINKSELNELRAFLITWVALALFYYIKA